MTEFTKFAGRVVYLGIGSYLFGFLLGSLTIYLIMRHHQ